MTPCRLLAGVKVQRGRRLPEQPSSDDLQTLKKRPWSAQLAEEEAQYQMTCMGEAAIGCPHPTSAGPDIIFQVGLAYDVLLCSTGMLTSTLLRPYCLFPL